MSCAAVVPAKAGTHTLCPLERLRRTGPCVRRDDAVCVADFLFLRKTN